MGKKLHISISPCPNDTFSFHAMLHGLVDTEGVSYVADFHDIDELNKLASAPGSGEEVVKVSYATLPLVAGRFSLLPSGGAIGYGNGPVVVSRGGLTPGDLENALIAIPGERTTAARLLSVLYPGAVKRKVYRFGDIAGAVVAGEVDAGVLIHEGRFTYAERGISLVTDLGREWEDRYSAPIPLGAIVVGKSLGESVAASVARTIRRSVEYALVHPDASAGFVARHAQELSEDVRRKHIEYFVNDFSLDLGARGLDAVRMFLGEDDFRKISLVDA